MNKLEEIQRLFSLYHQPEFLSLDPLTVVHRYRKSDTIAEIALVAALFSYGRVPQICRAIEQILAGTDSLSPHFFDSLQEMNWIEKIPEFIYRFHTREDLAVLLKVLSNIRTDWGTLTNWAQAELTATDSRLLFEQFSLFFKQAGQKVTDFHRENYDWLFPSPSGGSPCKRIAMFLRWMVRENDGIDLGVWPFISSQYLVMPVDTHVAKIAKRFEMTTKRSASWTMAQEITEFLRQLDPYDPVKYDFALCRAGMLDY